MKKTNKVTLIIATILLGTVESQAQSFATLANEVIEKINPVLGIGALLAFIAGIFYALQGEDGQSKAKWAFGAVAIALILRFGLAGMISTLSALLKI
jgi:hypothetical protein